MFKVPHLGRNEAQLLKCDYPTWLLFGYERNLFWTPQFQEVILVIKIRVEWQGSGWLHSLYFTYLLKSYHPHLVLAGKHHIHKT